MTQFYTYLHCKPDLTGICKTKSAAGGFHGLSWGLVGSTMPMAKAALITTAPARTTVNRVMLCVCQLISVLVLVLLICANSARLFSPADLHCSDGVIAGELQL